MNNEDRLDYLIGQVATLKSFCIALAITHREPAALQRAFAKAAEITTAKTLPRKPPKPCSAAWRAWRMIFCKSCKAKPRAGLPVRPNPSLEPTRAGRTLGPRGRGSYHRPRGPSAIPALAAQLKR